MLYICFRKMSTPMQFGGINQQLGQTAPSSLFRHRTTVYKVGLLCLLASFGLFVLGYSTPHWVTIRERFGDDSISVGLWNVFIHYGFYGKIIHFKLISTYGFSPLAQLPPLHFTNIVNIFQF